MTVRFKNIAPHRISSTFGAHVIDVGPGEEFDLPLVFQALPGRRGLPVEEVGRAPDGGDGLEPAEQPSSAFARIMTQIREATSTEQLDELGPEFAKAKGTMSAAQRDEIHAAAEARYVELDPPPASEPEPPPATLSEPPADPPPAPAEPATPAQPPASEPAEAPTGEQPSEPAEPAGDAAQGDSKKPKGAKRAGKEG